MIYNKQTCREKTLSLLSIDERMKLDAGLIFAGIVDGEPYFQGEDKEWKNYEMLQEKYTIEMQGELEELNQYNNSLK